MIDIKNEVKINLVGIWYRGTVIGISGDDCQVEFKRYGIMETKWFNRKTIIKLKDFQK